jgi:hypothetical protein
METVHRASKDKTVLSTVKVSTGNNYLNTIGETISYFSAFYGI